MTDNINLQETQSRAQLDTELPFTAAQSFRLLGTMLRLYPVQNSVVQETLAKANEDFLRYFQSHATLTISCRQNTLFINDSKAPKRLLTTGLQELADWMESAGLEIIQIARTVTEDELTTFLTALLTVEKEEQPTPLGASLMHLNLPAIRCGMLATSPAMIDVELDQTLAELEQTRQVYEIAQEESATLLSVPRDNARPATWQQLQTEYETISPAERKRALIKFAEWRKNEGKHISPAIVAEIDRWMTSKIKFEEEASVFAQLIALVESRCLQLIEAAQQSEASTFLDAMRTRARHLKSSQERRIIDTFLTHIALPPTRVDEAAQDAAAPLRQQAQQIRDLLGEQQVQALLTQLKTNNSQEERLQALVNIQEIGLAAQAELLRELQMDNPWYVYRNLLNVLTKIGDEQALKPIAEKLTHADIRVRIAAIAALAQIGREQAMPYLLQALQDPSPVMRATAAANAALCPEPKILDVLLTLLTPRFPWNAQPDNVRFMACMALGQFDDHRARRALMHIVHPIPLSFFYESEAMRCSAINALEKYATHPEVMRSLHRAANDAKLQVRQTAMQVLSRRQRGGSTTNELENTKAGVWTVRTDKPVPAPEQSETVGPMMK